MDTMTKATNETPDQREKRLAYQREYRRRCKAKDPDFNKAARARWKAKPGNSERDIASSFRYRHGVAREEADSMIADQDGLCAICKQSPISRLQVDHDHETGEIRAMLCSQCNQALGLLREDVSIVLSLVEYLKSYQPQEVS